jgi:hypothetical protein
MYPLDIKLGGSSSDIDAIEEFVADICVYEGVKEDIDIFFILSHYDLVNISKFVQGALYIIFV